MILLTAMWNVLLALAPSLLLGAVIAGALHVLLPPDLLSRQLRGRAGVLKAVALGVPLPLCSCGVLPTGLGLRRDGASDGATIGFLISTPQTGVDSVLVSASFLGWPFALFKVLSAAVTGVVGGWIADLSGPVEPTEEVSPASCASASGRGLREGLEHGFDLLRMIWRWLVVGILLSAAIEVLVPNELFAQFGSLGPIGAALAALLVALPLYVCATASVPIAAALVAGGMPTGAALVFLMAGPATNAATVGALYRAIGGRLLTIYLSVIIVGSIGFALAFDFLLGTNAAEHAVHEHSSAWWELGLAILLCGFIGWFAAEDLRRWARLRRETPSNSTTLEVAVAGMSCEGCVRNLETTLLASEKIEAAEVFLEPPHAVVHGTATLEEIHQLVNQSGYNAV